MTYYLTRRINLWLQFSSMNQPSWPTLIVVLSAGCWLLHNAYNQPTSPWRYRPWPDRCKHNRCCESLKLAPPSLACTIRKLDWYKPVAGQLVVIGLHHTICWFPSILAGNNYQVLPGFLPLPCPGIIGMSTPTRRPRHWGVLSTVSPNFPTGRPRPREVSGSSLGKVSRMENGQLESYKCKILHGVIIMMGHQVNEPQKDEVNKYIRKSWQANDLKGRANLQFFGKNAGKISNQSGSLCQPPHLL